jgi:hypothetical protein
MTKQCNMSKEKNEKKKQKKVRHIDDDDLFIDL